MRAIILTGCISTVLSGCNFAALTPVSTTFDEQTTLISQCAREIGVPSDGALVDQSSGVLGGTRLTVLAGNGIDQATADALNSCVSGKTASLSRGDSATIDPAASFTSAETRWTTVGPATTEIPEAFCPLGASVLYGGNSYCLVDR